MSFIRCFGRSTGTILTLFKSTRFYIHHFWYGLGQTFNREFKYSKTNIYRELLSKKNLLIFKKSKKSFTPLFA